MSRARCKSSTQAGQPQCSIAEGLLALNCTNHRFYIVNTPAEVAAMRSEDRWGITDEMARYSRKAQEIRDETGTLARQNIGSETIIERHRRFIQQPDFQVPFAPSDFYRTHLESLHQQLLASAIVRAYLTGTGIRLDGIDLHADDVYELPIGTFSVVEFAHLLSVFDGSRVHQQVERSFSPDDGPPGLYFTVINARLIQHPGKNRLGLYADPNGGTDLFIDGLHVDQYFLNERHTPPTLGTLAFALCAITAHQAGLSQVSLVAAGGRGFDARHIGYKVWPKLGFNAPLEPEEVAQAPRLTHCRCVQDVLAVDAAWWEDHGSQRLMTFDLTASSTSWRKLLPYVTRKLSDGRLP